MIKIPGTTEGVQAIDDAIAEGINVNVTLLFSVESYTNIAEAYIRGMERRLERRRLARRALGRELLRLARGHRGRQAPRGARARGPARHRGGRQRARRLPALQGALPRRALRRRCARPAPASSARCGPRPASRTRATPTRSTSRSWSRPTPSTRCRWRRSTPAPTTSRSSGPTGDQDPSAELRQLADAGIDMTDVTQTLLDEGIAKFVEPFDKLADGIELAREGVVTGRRRRSSR